MDDKFIVLELEKIEKHLPEFLLEELVSVIKAVDLCLGGHLTNNRYYVVNANDTYADKVRELILSHKNKKAMEDE